MISLNSISFEEEIERWAMILEKECLTQFTNKNTGMGTMNKPGCPESCISQGIR